MLGLVLWKGGEEAGLICGFFFFQAEDGIRDLVRSRGLGDVYNRQAEILEKLPDEAFAREGVHNRFEMFVNDRFEQIRQRYAKMLRGVLGNLPAALVFAVIILGSNYFLFVGAKNELAPQEDQGIIISLITTAPNATLEQTQLNSRQVFELFRSYPETGHIFQLDGINGLNSGVAGMVLKPWDERKRTTMELNPEIQRRLGGIAGAQVVSFLRPPLPGSTGLPVQFLV